MQDWTVTQRERNGTTAWVEVFSAKGQRRFVCAVDRADASYVVDALEYGLRNDEYPEAKAVAKQFTAALLSGRQGSLNYAKSLWADLVGAA